MIKLWISGALALITACGFSSAVNAQAGQQDRRSLGERQRVIDPVTGKVEERRAVVRINTRLDTRLHTRIDRFYGSQTDLRSSYTPKADDTTKTTETTKR